MIIRQRFQDEIPSQALELKKYKKYREPDKMHLGTVFGLWVIVETFGKTHLVEMCPNSIGFPQKSASVQP